jgi:hypothetical protein
MKSGSPPSSLAFARESAALVTERGNLRESLGGLRNLGQLLNSLRVGSRPLSSVLPASRDAVDPLRHSMGAIIAAVVGALGEQQATADLTAYVSPRLAELEAALAEAAERALNVKTRLSLEESVTRLSRELDSARHLFDLLCDAIAARPIHLEVLELARQSFSGPPSGGSWPRETLTATLGSDAHELEIEVDPRVATSHNALGVELVAIPGARGVVPHIQVRPVDGGCHISIGRGSPTSGEELVLVRRGVIAPTLPCVAAAARASGATLDFNPVAGRFSLTFPTAFPGQLQGATG